METYFENIRHAQGVLAREQVLADLKSLVRDSEDLLKATSGDVSEKAKETRARVSAALERVKVSCSGFPEQTAATAKAAAKQAQRAIRTHPYEFVGAAFGLGLLIGALITRR